MGLLSDKTNKFREQVAQLPREEILHLIELQDPELRAQVNRIEWVFENKLRHLNWADGTPILHKPIPNDELALLVDEPFNPDPELGKLGLSLLEQRQLHIAKDPVLWAKEFLGIRPRAYQIMIIRHPSLFKVLRSGRRAGKTFSLALIALHYAYTTAHGRVLILTPMKTQGALIYEEMMKFVKESQAIGDSLTRNVTSPQYEINMSNGSTIRFFSTGMKSGGKCLTPDHDVLSEDGWKPIDEILPGEYIMSWKPNGEYYWGEISETHEYDFDGELVSHEGKQISFRVTPNHKFAAKTRAPNSEWNDIYAEDLKDYYVPTGGIPTLPLHYEYSAEELELWGWWLAEGSGFIGKMARISQAKEYGRKRIVELAERLGLHYTTPKKEIRVEWRPPIYSGTNAYNKFIPRELFNVVGSDTHLMDGLLDGDGWRRKKGWEYSSSSFQLANDVQELAVRKGLRANIREKTIRYVPVGGGLPNRHWVVSAYDYKESVLNKEYLQSEPYHGKVHCVTVPESGYFLVRHNGLVHITGNSDVTRGQEAHVIILDELDYMGDDDLEAIFAMMQKTTDNQKDKQMIGASTPTGRRAVFWDWCTIQDPDKNPFIEFWFPAYVNPFWDAKMENFFRNQYTEMGYRHEIEADWGEDVDGVYPLKYVDMAFHGNEWHYEMTRSGQDTYYVMGVDWDKYGAGTNIVILEVWPNDHENKAMRGKCRVCYREETKKDQYSLTKAVDRIIYLNRVFDLRHIYVDRGFGEVQVELLHKHGIENPKTGLEHKVVGISFAESIEMRDPFRMEKVKKEIKPFMIDNLRQFLERQMIMFPESDEELYLQLISYVVARQTALGRPVFEAPEKIGDHAHDALILACLAITQNYGELMRVKYATESAIVSNTMFLPTVELSGDPTERHEQEEYLTEKYGSLAASPIRIKRPGAGLGRRAGPVRRSMF